MKVSVYRQAQQEDDGYEQFLEQIRINFALVTAHTPHLFTTDARELFDSFVDALPVDRQQHYTCHACRNFVERYGGLVSLDLAGTARPVMWNTDSAVAMFAYAVERMDRVVRRAKVTGVFLSKDLVWGEPSTGPWNHMAVVPRSSVLHKPTRLLNNWQQMSENVQDHATLWRALVEFDIAHVRKAKALLESDSLYRSGKMLGVAKWLLDLQERMAETKDQRARDNMVWLAVAMAPAGWCHVRSTMIGTLLEDLQAGKPFAEVEQSFKLKMDPLAYRRPQVLPSDGQIAAAEKLMATLNSESALGRRFAKIEDITCVWKPPVILKPAHEGGVFAHLKQDAKAGVTDLGAPAKVMSWVVFARDVLPKAEKIEFLVPHERAGFFAFVTAANPNAPPIVQWDRHEQRNPVTWYLHCDRDWMGRTVSGSFASAWNMRPNEWRNVMGVALAPYQWDPKVVYENHTKHACFMLDGAKDTTLHAGGGMFPELLRSEYHAIRGVLEAHFNRTAIEGREEATACGVLFSAGNASWRNTFRVTAGGMRSLYRLDRWE